MRVPAESDLDRLLRWNPDGGIVSVYVDLHPEDRGEAWRIELRNATAELLARTESGHDDALEATLERIKERIEDAAGDPSGRTQIAFVEVARKPGREEWFAVQAPRPRPTLVFSRRPWLRPLVAVLAGGAPRGIAVVTAERVRLLRWTLGAVEELDDWGLEVFSLDWRERKSKRSADTARVQGAKSSGRDQFDQRLDANRERFLVEVAGLASAELRHAGCAEVIVFGDPQHAATFTGAVNRDVGVAAVEHHNLIGERAAVIGERAGALIADLNQRRERELVARVDDEARGGTRGALGVEETAQALAEGRVEHLLLDAEESVTMPEAAREALAASGAGTVRADGDDVAERMVELALATGASITPVSGEAAETLSEVGGAAAILRY